MMRKLLVLFAVMAMTSVASAQLIDLQIASLNGEPIDPVKEITIEPSDIIDMDIVIMDTTLLTIDTIVRVNGMASLLLDAGSLAEITWVGDDEGFRGPPTPLGADLALGTGNFNGMSGLVIDHILLHCDDEPGVVTVSLVPNTMFGGTFNPDGSPYTGAWGSVTVHQVPEPMTIALLGLGGLVLLRRRK